MTNKQLAINLIKFYVLEYGETFEQLRKSRMGHFVSGVSANIGGYINGKFHSDKIFVKQNGEEDVFSLKEIYDEIKKPATGLDK